MTKTLARDPSRRCKPLGEWPPRDQELWLSALAPGDVIDGAGGRAGYAYHTNRKIASSYGRWLQWLDFRGNLNVVQHPSSRITPDRVVDYVHDLAVFNSTQSLLSRVTELQQMALILDPTQDWNWLSRISASLRARHIPARPTAPRIVAIDELFSLGMQLMSDAPRRDTPLQRALQYRDGLIVALLAARPLRRRNLAGLLIGHSLVRRGGGWWLDIPGSETKTRSPISMPLPAILSTAVDSYITTHRDFLMGQRGRWWRAPDAALWISSHGSPMTEMALYDRIIATTRAHFGRGINPHFFRNCAATSFAHDDPDHVRLAAPLLGHRTFETTDRFYVLAGSRRAVRRWQDYVMALRNGHGERM